MKSIDVTKWMAVDEVARLLGLSEDRVRRLIRLKKIRASKIGKWLVSPEDLNAFVRSRMNIQEL